jgi:predicted membrane channel-forming protein YqfA (hemolysin III family)
MCPWSDYAPATIAFCERRLCAWVVEPSNAWSNVAYVLVGVWILWHRRAALGTALTAIGVAAILLGLGSFSFHATGVRVFEVVDVSGMYLISGLALTFALQRLLAWSDAVAVAFFVAVVLASSLLMIGLGNDGIVMFGVQTFAAVALEVHLRARTPPGVAVWLVRAMAAMAIGLVIWVLDLKGALCDPDNHVVTGHAVWHVLTAVAVLCFYRFQERLRDAVAAVD